MKSTSLGKVIGKQLWGIIKTGLLCFLFYLLSIIIINLVFYSGSDVPREERSNVPVYIVLVFINAFAFYFAYVRATMKTYKANSEQKFSVKNELAEYIKSEGKFFFIIYGVLAVIYEVSAHLIPVLNVLVAVLVFVFPAAGALTKIPVLDIFVGYVVSMLTILCVTIIARYREWRYWSKGK